MSLRLFYRQLLESVSIGKKIRPRVLPKTPEGGFQQKASVLVLGSITAPDALNPPAEVKKEDTTNQIYMQEGLLLETIGTDISAIEKQVCK